MSKLSITCSDFKPLHRNTLRGFATIHIDELKLEIRDVAVHEKNGARWAQLPAKPMLDQNGTPLRDSTTGKISYVNILWFPDRKVRDAFSAATVDAVLRAYPSSLAMEAHA